MGVKSCTYPAPIMHQWCTCDAAEEASRSTEMAFVLLGVVIAMIRGRFS